MRFTPGIKVGSKQDVTNPPIVALFGDVLADSTQVMSGRVATLPTFTDKIGERIG